MPRCTFQPDGESFACVVCGRKLDPSNPQPVCDGAARTLVDLTIVVTCFLRFDRLVEFLKSARAFYPGVAIVVADNSLRDGEQWPAEVQEWADCPGVKLVRCEFDVGVAGVRNRAFAHVETEFCVLCEEDFVFSHATDLEALQSVVAAGDVDLCAGLCIENGRVRNWSGRWRRNGAGNELHQLPLDSRWQWAGDVPWRETDCVLNFFCTRTALLLQYPGDESFKAAHEHLDWMLEWQRHGLRLAYTPACLVDHVRDVEARTPLYNELRGRTFREELYRKWNLDHHTASGPQHEAVGVHRERSDAGNLVLLTIGHTGSSIACGLLRLFGWQIDQCDDEFNEPRRVRDINQMILRGVNHNRVQHEIDDCLESMAEPWLLKDPRLCETVEVWLPSLARYRPALLWLERDIERVRDSYASRGQRLDVVDRRQRSAEAIYQFWPWQKRRVDLHDVAEWCAAFDSAKHLGD